MLINTLGSPSLITPDGYMDQLTAMGHKGTLLLLERGYKTLSWKDTDFHLDIKVAWLVNSVALNVQTFNLIYRGVTADQGSHPILCVTVVVSVQLWGSNFCNLQ